MVLRKQWSPIAVVPVEFDPASRNYFCVSLRRVHPPELSTTRATAAEAIQLYSPHSSTGMSVISYGGG